MSTQEPGLLAEGSSVLGRYRIIRRLGKGAFGTSYLAEEAATGRRVVLKVASSADEDGSLGRRLVAEGRILTRLDSPRVARLLEVGALEDGRPFLVLEWIDGPTLHEILSAGPLSVPTALAVVSALSEALAAAHAIGVIHRDLKPTNVVVPAGPGGLRFGEATLIDFGAFGELVRRVRSQDVTQVGEFFGTPHYMAPEQIAATPQSPATDVYGVGLLLYAMLFGQPPFFDLPLFPFLTKRSQADIPVPSSPALPEDVRSFLAGLLRRDPAARPRSAADVRSGVERLRRRLHAGEATGAIPVGIPVPAASTAGSGDLPGEATAMSGAPRRSRAGRILLVGTLAGTLLLLVLFLFVRKPGIATAFPGGSGAALASLDGIAAGLFLIGGGVALGFALSRFLRRWGGEVQQDAARLLLGARSRDVLTSTLAVQIDELIARCRRVDERILGITIAQLVGEYQVAADGNQRQAALMNAAQLLEKLMARLSPWYVRHEKALAFALSLVGILTGTVSLVASVVKLFGKP